MNFAVRATFVFSVLLLSSVTEAQDTSLCRQYGTSAGLSQTQVQQVCRGAKSNNDGAARCFLKARDSAGLLADDAIQLCRCAETSAPASCVSASMQKLNIGRQEALLTCGDPSRKSPSERQCLGFDGPSG
jgi:hypothetical protein